MNPTTIFLVMDGHDYYGPDLWTGRWPNHHECPAFATEDDALRYIDALPDGKYLEVYEVELWQSAGPAVKAHTKEIPDRLDTT